MNLDIFNPENLINAIGYSGIFTIVFLESGTFFAFFLPGDSLLFSAGFLASQGILNFELLILGFFLSSFLGVIMGYYFGLKTGEKIFYKKGSLFFDPKNIKRTRAFYQKYGKATIVFSRFVPIVRTFAPILAGVGGMHFKNFLFYDFVGSAIWVIFMTSLGYFFGAQIPALHEYVLPVSGVLFLSTFIPIFYGLYKNYKYQKNNKVI